MSEPQYCEICNFPLSQCSAQDGDGEPTLDCKVCDLREKLTTLRTEHERVKAELERAATNIEQLHKHCAEADKRRDDARTVLDEYIVKVVDLRSDLEQRTKERDTARDTMRAANRGAETNAHALRLSSERNIKLMAERDAAHAALRQCVDALEADMHCPGRVAGALRLQFALAIASARAILDKAAPVAGADPSSSNPDAAAKHAAATAASRAAYTKAYEQP